MSDEIVAAGVDLSTPRITNSTKGVDWELAKAALRGDDFDNGRSPEQLRRSFESSQYVSFAWDDDLLIGMARLLSDGVCNAYLLDVWTRSSHRRRGVARAMVEALAECVPGHHIGLQTGCAQDFYGALGFRRQPEFMSKVVGTWLNAGADSHPA